MGADQFDGRGAEGFIQPSIRGATTPLADQPGYPFLLVAISQSAHLAGAMPICFDACGWLIFPSFSLSNTCARFTSF